MLAENFRQFNIEAVPVTSDAAERLRREKFEACALALGDGADQVMESVRSSPSNSRCIIYGVGGSAQVAMRYSKYGINAMFNEPLERPAALKLIRATRMLVLHEFRRYVRIPVMTEVCIIGDGRKIVGSSIEMSSGGMSVKSSGRFLQRYECRSVVRPHDSASSEPARCDLLAQTQIYWRAFRLY